MEYHPKFKKYVEMIVAHPNYRRLYYDRNKDNEVNWVVTGKSEKGQKRQKWWDEKCRELRIPIQKGCYAKAARKIHPTGWHVCQTCGEKRSIFYEYPTLNTLKRLKELLPIDIDIKQTDYTIRQIVQKFCKTASQLTSLAKYFNITEASNKEDFINSIYSELVDNESNYFSPGVMSNSPDRFDGFHSYGLCCRQSKDKGRDKNNMKTYTQDRRAYEEWSDGNWNLANRLMGEFGKAPEMKCPKCNKVEKMTADHIGPISLGFCHSTHFTPLCNSCNSAKNNRFTKEDVDTLLKIEKGGNQVISWHSKYIWDLLKNQIRCDSDAKKASSIMAKCHQNIINVLALIYCKTGQEFLLRYLHPEYAMYDYRFNNFNLTDLKKMEIITKKMNSKNKQKNKERYIRIAFESLKKFAQKGNRKTHFLLNKKSPKIKKIVSAIKMSDYDQADTLLKKTLRNISAQIYNAEWTEQ